MGIPLSSDRTPIQKPEGALEALPVRPGDVKRETINRALEDIEVQDLMARTHDQLKQVLPLSEQDRARLQEVIAFLEDPELMKLVESGHITFGMIKPRTHEAKAATVGTDEEIAQQVHEAVQPPLVPLISQPFWISGEQAGQFYAHLKKLPAGIFERVAGFMASGAVTGLVLYSHEGNAVQEWRRQMGPTNPATPSENGSRETIRHRFADDVSNNVVHGSDSIESVKNELAFLAAQLRKML